MEKISGVNLNSNLLTNAVKTYAANTTLLSQEAPCDTFEITANNKSQTNLQYKNLSMHSQKGIACAEDLKSLVDSENVTKSEMQKIVSKHFNTDKVIIKTMDEYDRPLNGARAAITRPYFNSDGTIDKIEMFLPKPDKNDSAAVLDFISKTAHEMTHVSQILSTQKGEIPHYQRTPEGQLLNQIQKIITDKYTDKFGADIISDLLVRSNTKVNDMSDILKFYDKPMTVNKEVIADIMKLGKDDAAINSNLNKIFDVIYDSLVPQMCKNPYTKQIIDAKGQEAFKALVKQACHTTFVNEQEAYLTEQIIRQKLTHQEGVNTVYDSIHITMQMCADAIK